MIEESGKPEVVSMLLRDVLNNDALARFIRDARGIKEVMLDKLTIQQHSPVVSRLDEQTIIDEHQGVIAYVCTPFFLYSGKEATK